MSVGRPHMGTEVGHARVHVALHDVGTRTMRRYGGVGFAVEEPTTRVAWAAGPDPMRVEAACDVEGSTLAQLAAAVERLAVRLGRPLTGMVVVEACAPAHRGYGSKTAILLTTLRAAARASAVAPGRGTLLAASGRGGTSGVGAHSDLGGGLVCDAGHPQHDGPSRPSSATVPDGPPLLLVRHAMPQDWIVGLVDAPVGTGPSGARETAVFAGHELAQTPDEAARSIALTYHGVVPAVATSDLPALKSAVRAQQEIGFKRAEWAVQDPMVRDLAAALDDTEAAVGLSSMGPLLYAIARADDATTRRRVDDASDHAGATTTWTRPLGAPPPPGPAGGQS